MKKTKTIVGWELMKTVDAKIGGDFLGRAAYYEVEGKGVDLHECGGFQS